MDAVKVGICGLGTVGYGSFTVLKNNSEEIARRVGQQVVVTQIASRALKADQDIGNIPFTTDVMEVVQNPEIDIVLELIGGVELALKLVLTAIENGKHVVTANKALIALHGNEIFAAAKAKNVIVAYEAAVAGGIPIIKGLREGLASNHIQWIAGIINGTSNFILSEMREKGSDFSAVLKQAQELGYAEADPTFDIEGIDAAHKLTILSSIAFGIPLQFEKAYTEGISEITIADIRNAEELGYRIKHLGLSAKTEEGIELRVHPALINEENLLANVNGVMNAVMVNGDAVGSTLYYGAGAGAMPTGAAVVSDVVDVVRNMRGLAGSVPALAFEADALSDTKILPIESVESAYYLRISVKDKAGVMADITEILGDLNINIEAIIQKDKGTNAQIREEDQLKTVIILTHKVKESVMLKAIGKIESLGAVAKKVTMIRVADLGDE